MGRGFPFPRWFAGAKHSGTKARQRAHEYRGYDYRRLQIQPLEDRSLLSVAPPTFLPLNVVLISDAVAQAPQVRDAAANGTIAIVYRADTMTTTGLVNTLESVSAAHDGARIGHLGIVAHGGPGEIDLGNADDLSLATLPTEAAALEQLRPLFGSDASVDLYSCLVAAGAGGETFVDELAADTGATVFASNHLVGTVPGADFNLDYHAGQAGASNELFSLQELDAIPNLSLGYSITPNPASVNENAGSLTFTVSRSPSTSAATVYVSTVQDPNHPNTNNYYYNGFVAQPLNFSAGQSTATVTVTINDENLTSGSESPSLLVQTLSGGVYSNAASDTFTINNTDVVQTTYSITPNPASVNENAGSLTFTVSRSPSTSAATVYVSTVQDPNHPNTNNYYYNGFVAQPLNFSAGQSTATVTVTINDENLTSGSESPSLLVQTLSGGVYSNAASDTFTINNTDVVQTTYSITPNPASVNENAGSLTFTVSRSPSTSAATVYVSTVQDPNHPNTNNYYYNGFVAQPLNFSAGQSTATVTVTINDENLTSGSESPSLLVQTLSGGVYSNAASDTFTINNTDVVQTTYSITPNPASVNENAGSLTFTVSRSPSTSAATVYVSTVQDPNHPNTNNYYYNGFVAQPLNFSAGQSTATVTVTINDENLTSGSESPSLLVQTLSGGVYSNAASDTFTINNTDVVQTTYSITPNPASVNENAGSLTFTVSRSPSTSAATVYVSTVQDPNHPNTNNYYYNGFVAQPLNFSAGQSTATVTVTINDENLTSGSESPASSCRPSPAASTRMRRATPSRSTTPTLCRPPTRSRRTRRR